MLQISGSGLVAPSGMFFNAKYSKLHIGNFTDERFIDIFRSERYRRSMICIIRNKLKLNVYLQ